MQALARSIAGASALALSLPLVMGAAPALAAPAYALTKTVPLGAPDRWDYVVFDGGTHRVYVAHNDRLAVIDAASGALVGEVAPVPGGTHGTAISLGAGQGFTDDGRSGQAVAFDLKTLKVVKSIPADADADAMVADKATGNVFVIEGDPGKITVIDPRTDGVVGTISAGEKMEYAAADGHGAIFVAGEEKRDLLKIDARRRTVVARWPTPECASPHGLALDVVHHRAFMGCVNSMLMVVDTQSGRTVAKLPIGRGSDAVAFDPVRRRVFSSNGADGDISVFQQTSPDRYQPLAHIRTIVSARTMDVDPKSGRLFVAGADTDPPSTPGGRPKTRPGTLKLMFFDVVK